MNRNDLYVAYARVIEMCKGTALEEKELQCFRTKLCSGKHDSPANDALLWLWRDTNCKIEVAVAILEDKPVFEGDVLFGTSGTSWTVQQDRLIRNTPSPDAIYFHNIKKWSRWSWQLPEPKRTFKLDGFELSSPLRVLQPGKKRHMLQIHDNAFYFETDDDYLKTCGAIISILSEAKNK